MVKKKLTLIITCLLFCFASTFAQKKKSRQNAPAKVEAKAPNLKTGKKNQNRKKVIDYSSNKKD
jgi:hypothetical protein